jgi:hypothetical protein
MEVVSVRCELGLHAGDYPAAQKLNLGARRRVPTGLAVTWLALCELGMVGRKEPWW